MDEKISMRDEVQWVERERESICVGRSECQ